MMPEGRARIYDRSILGVIEKAMKTMWELAQPQPGSFGYAEVERINIMGDGYRLGYVTWEHDFPVFVFDYEEL